MIIVIAEVTALSEHREAFGQRLAETAVASRDEPGCLSYGFFADVEDGNKFSAIEQWESRADLDTHLGSAGVADLLGWIPDKVAGPPVITVHEVSSSSTVG